MVVGGLRFAWPWRELEAIGRPFQVQKENDEGGGPCKPVPPVPVHKFASHRLAGRYPHRPGQSAEYTGQPAFSIAGFGRKNQDTSAPAAFDLPTARIFITIGFSGSKDIRPAFRCAGKAFWPFDPAHSFFCPRPGTICQFAPLTFWLRAI